MLDNYELYKIWAPDNALWTQWAKPVVFSCQLKEYPYLLPSSSAEWAPTPNNQTAIIVDLPGKDSVLEGIALAKRGYRPVPLYNGVDVPSSAKTMVNVQEVLNALHASAHKLSSIDLSLTAPPVFLLDHNRMKATNKIPGTYDNRWCVFPQDMPSATFLIEHGIKKIIIRSSHIEMDLNHILMRYQEKGIEVYQFNEKQYIIKKVLITKPSYFKSMYYRIKIMSGLTPNTTGGFGGMIPEPSQSNGSYHRMG